MLVPIQSTAHLSYLTRVSLFRGILSSFLSSAVKTIRQQKRSMKGWATKAMDTWIADENVQGRHYLSSFWFRRWLAIFSQKFPDFAGGSLLVCRSASLHLLKQTMCLRSIFFSGLAQGLQPQPSSQMLKCEDKRLSWRSLTNIMIQPSTPTTPYSRWPPCNIYWRLSHPWARPLKQQEFC